MQKVYLLLRNNQRTGPYSLDELLELQLKPFDLVWVEGRSTGWRYPAEIDSLKSYVAEPSRPATPFEPLPTSALDQQAFIPNTSVQPSAPSGKKVFVSMPVTPRPAYNQTAEEEISQPSIEAFSSIPKYAPGYRESASTINNRISNEPAFQPKPRTENYTSLYLPKKTKKPLLRPGSIAAMVVIVVLGAAGYYFLTADKSNTSSPNLVSQSVQQPVNDNIGTGAATVEEETSVSKSDQKKSVKKEKITKSVTEPSSKKPGKTNTVVLPSIDQTVVKDAPQPTTADENNKKSAEVIAGTETPSKEKKKKLGEAIKDIFKPKEKAKQEEKKETVMEEPKPATNRQSTKREDGNSETKINSVSNEELATMVDITSNAPDNWMMGVKGLKLTLRNRSNTAIQSASVDLVYYNDNNQVLEKKVIYFNNIAAKGKSTVAAPDHKFADHVEFKLTTVTAREDRFVRN